MDISPTIHSRRAAAFADEALRGPLPALVMGDGAMRVPRRHEWPGRLFITLSYLTAAAMALGVVTFGAFALEYGLEPRHWLRVAGVGVWGVLQWRLAGEVRRFSRWGWYGAMTELGAAVAANLGLAMFVPIIGGRGLVMLALNVACMRYFWRRRADFDVDLGG